jgi:hypothetical protein
MSSYEAINTLHENSKKCGITTNYQERKSSKIHKQANVGKRFTNRDTKREEVCKMSKVGLTSRE